MRKFVSFAVAGLVVLYLAQVLGYPSHAYYTLSIIVAFVLAWTIAGYLLQVVLTKRPRNRHSAITILISLISIPTMWLTLNQYGYDLSKSDSHLTVVNRAEREIHVEVGNNHGRKRYFESFSLPPGSSRRIPVSLYKLGICTDTTPCYTIGEESCDGIMEFGCPCRHCTITVPKRGHLGRSGCTLYK